MYSMRSLSVLRRRDSKFSADNYIVRPLRKLTDKCNGEHSHHIKRTFTNQATGKSVTVESANGLLLNKENFDIVIQQLI